MTYFCIWAILLITALSPPSANANIHDAVIHDVIPPCERIYFDHRDLNGFNIHVGDNIWIHTSKIERDDTGFYTHISAVHRVHGPNGSMEYIRKWKCPYCNRYWPIGEPCGNADCPSRYK